MTRHVLWCVKAASTLSQILHCCICAAEDNGSCSAVLKGEDYLGPAALVRLPSTWQLLDYKIVRFFCVSSTREQSNKRTGGRLKTESETGERWSLCPFILRRLCACTSYSYAKPILKKKKRRCISSNRFRATRSILFSSGCGFHIFFTKILQLLIKKGLENFGIKTKRPIMDNKKTFYYPWSHRIFVESTAIPQGCPLTFDQTHQGS